MLSSKTGLLQRAHPRISRIFPRKSEQLYMCTPFKLVHLCIVADDGPDALVFEPLLWDPSDVLLEGEGEDVSSGSKDSSSI